MRNRGFNCKRDSVSIGGKPDFLGERNEKFEKIHPYEGAIIACIEIEIQSHLVLRCEKAAGKIPFVISFSTSRIRLFLASLTACMLVSQLGAAGSHDRIVTIGGSATEIVWALGAGDSVVAVDLSSTYPPEVRNLPQVGYIRQISPEGVLSMKPSLIIAEGALGPPAARDMLERVSVPVVWLPDPVEIDDLRRSVRLAAEKLKRPEKGEELIKEIESQLAEARRRVEAELDKKPSVLFLLEPPGGTSEGMAAGVASRADTLIRLAGGRNAAKSISGFQPISRESLLAMNPDVILVAQSSGHGGSPAAIQAMRESRALAGVSAVRNNAVHAVPLDDIAFGPRVGEAVLRWTERLIEWTRLEQK